MWRRYLADPFGFVDSLELRMRGSDVNFFRHDEALRDSAAWFTWLCVALWCVTGWDGAEAQLEKANFLGFLLGQISWSEVVAGYYSGYGQWLHWSALVTYGIVFIYVGRYLRRVGIMRSLNVVLSCCFTFLSIGVFEFYWMWCYSVFQGQPWVLTFEMPQARIIVQNLGFSVVGFLGVAYMWAMDLKWRPTKRFIVVVIFTITLAVLWVYYPFPVRGFEVAGWHNSPMFPQTLYTIDTTPLDGVNAGVGFFVEDNVVHLFNVAVKALSAWAVLEAARGWTRYELG
jgi:hypothetical protein